MAKKFVFTADIERRTQENIDRLLRAEQERSQAVEQEANMTPTAHEIYEQAAEQITRLEAENQRLREALAKYADKNNWDLNGEWWGPDSEEAGWWIAKNALEVDHDD